LPRPGTSDRRRKWRSGQQAGVRCDAEAIKSAQRDRCMMKKRVGVEELAGRKHKLPAALSSVEAFRARAARVLPKMVFDFVDGGSGGEDTVRANRAALQQRYLLSSAPIDVSDRTTKTRLFGKSSGMPLIIGPTGFAGAVWPQGDIALARAAAKHRIPYVVSHGANSSLEDIAAACPDGRRWLQLYLSANREVPGRLIERASDLGFEAIEVTVDTAVPGRRLRDITNGFTMPFSWSPGKLLDVLAHPAWALRALRQGMPQPGLLESDRPGNEFATIADFARSQINPAVGWDDIAWIRNQWKGLLIVKGVLDPQQVEHAIRIGCDGIVVSNHGGRQLDGAVATMDVLADIVASAGGKLTVLIDSGFRSGSDILKALAIGASAVQLGRATLYGLAVAGEAGVDAVLDVLRAELDIALALTGITTPTDASPRLVRTRAGIG